MFTYLLIGALLGASLAFIVEQVSALIFPKKDDKCKTCIHNYWGSQSFN